MNMHLYYYLVKSACVSAGSSVLRIVSFCVGLIVDFVGWVACSDPRQKRERVAS